MGQGKERRKEKKNRGYLQMPKVLLILEFTKCFGTYQDNAIYTLSLLRK